MEVVGAVVALAPVLLLMVLVVLRTRRLWRRPPVVQPRPWPQTGSGGDTAGDREPRRPLVPSRTGRLALPLPEEDETEEAPASGPGRGRADPGPALRAS